MNDTTNTTSDPLLFPSITSLVLAYCITASELLAAAATVPLTALNLYAITSTHVLHVNMKLILLSQAIAIQLQSACRFAQLLYVLVTGRLFTYPLMALNTLEVFGVIMGGLVGYLLVVERVYATIRVKTYEKETSAALGIGCLLFLVSYLDEFSFSSLLFSSSPRA